MNLSNQSRKQNKHNSQNIFKVEGYRRHQKSFSMFLKMEQPFNHMYIIETQ